MWNLALPTSDFLADLNAALERADGTFDYELLPAETDLIIEIYTQYDQLKGQPSSLLVGSNIKTELRNVLYDSYNHVQQDKRLQYLRDKIKILAQRCPMCGVGAVTDLDHYLPRSEYKVLAIYCRNLIPACHTCNNKKRVHTSKQFIHAYLESLPSDKFLHCDTRIEKNALVANFSIRKTKSMSDVLFERIRYQIERLELAKRYQSEVNVFLSSQETAVYLAYGDDENSQRLRDFLMRSARSHEEKFGLNDWRTALLFGLQDNQDFCNGGFRNFFESFSPLDVPVN